MIFSHFGTSYISAAIQIGLLQLHPFMNSHFHLLIVIESSTTKMLLQRPKQRTWEGQGYRTDHPDVAGEMALMTRVSDVRCVGCATVSHLATYGQISCWE